MQHFSYAIIQISRYLNMLQMSQICAALGQYETEHQSLYLADLSHQQHTSTFVLLVAFPLVSLCILNSVVWYKLQKFRRNASRIGRQQRKTIRATVSLIAIIVLFVVCNSLRVIINTYQLFGVS